VALRLPGINAGVILLRPSEIVFQQMLKEVTSENHPAHIAGNGPEQAQGFGTMDDEMFLWFCKQHSKVKCN